MINCMRCKIQEREAMCIYCTDCRKSGLKEDITELWNRETKERLVVPSRAVPIVHIED